ncbi:BREX system ATP-binding domain-containing protein [Leisingera sp. F5]|uniref:BREX system ATP-binding domain-containing protein n=1 Tax=Leisingera sp. F5 TaxID=1813816 RepID=UPI000B0A9E67|nr:BREX system ATP-binding domain-containing protein [Leisingera sp. F5]
MSRLKPRERDAIVQALRAGVVPKLGLRHIQVGRVREIEELVKDMDRIADGGSAIRFIIGEYGSGKTFFMNLIRLVALEKGLVVMFADLAPDRRIHATGGAGTWSLRGNGPQPLDPYKARRGSAGQHCGAICLYCTS